jgi:TPR repeat protein
LGRLYEAYNNKKEAKKWYEKSAKLNHLESQFELAKLLIDMGNESEAKIWLKRASSQGFQEAKDMLRVLDDMKVTGTYYLIVQSNKIFNSKMVDSVKKYSKLGYSSFIYLTSTDIYTTVIRGFSKAELQSIKKILLEKKLIASDSYISTGDNFIEQVYPQKEEK